MIGSKVFPLTLDLLGEDANTLIDKLNKLEKIGYIDDANWWMDLRETRNHVTHDYPDEYSTLVKHFNKLAQQAQELLLFWSAFKDKLEKRKE